MSPHPAQYPLPVTSVDAALVHVELALARPLEAETIALFTTDDYLPGTCLIIHGCHRPDDIVGMAESLAGMAEGATFRRLVLVSSRPGQGFEASDVERWFHLDHFFMESGVDLLEWFVCDEHSRVAVSAVAGEQIGRAHV